MTNHFFTYWQQANYNAMTKDEALAAMKKGQRVTHAYFLPSEWMTMTKSGQIITEDGITQDAEEFWTYRSGDGWNQNYSLTNNIS